MGHNDQPTLTAGHFVPVENISDLNHPLEVMQRDFNENDFK